jgi:lipopolysaccharide heptosyltransferase I
VIHLPADPQRILIVKPSALGDIVHTLPVLKLLRNRWPAAHIEWLVMPAFASLLERHPLLNGIIRFDRKHFASSWRNPSRAKELKAFASDLMQRNFDLVIDFQGLFRSAWMTRQTGARTRVGFAYAREFAPLAYTHRVPQPTPERHATERYLDIAEALGCGRGPVEFEFGLTNADYAAAADLVGGTERYAVLIPGTNWPTKRWPAESYAALAPRIEDELGLTVFFAGSPAEAKLIPPDARSLAGRTTLPQLVALLEKASLVIANDSGPMHIASALSCPLVTMFGPTNPVRTGPYSRPDTVLQLDLVCRPCYSRQCVHTSCMHWITVNDVMLKAREQLVR